MSLPPEDLGVYTGGWYSDHANPEPLRQAYLSARAIVDVLRPKSAIDVGCGIGTFLRACADAGANPCRGVEAPHAFSFQEFYRTLQVPSDWVSPYDLRELPANAPYLGQRFDLAICVETAEHLPEETGPRLVDYLARLSDTVAWTAAHAHQGGVGHIHLRDPPYWAELFRERDFTLDQAVTEEIRSRYVGKIPLVPWYEPLFILRRQA